MGGSKPLDQCQASLESRLVRPVERDLRCNQGPMNSAIPEESGDAISG